MVKEDVKIGVFVCHCGKNIADVVDVVKLSEFAKSLPNVSFTMDYKFMCANEGQEIIGKKLQDGEINRVVVAACSPLMHEQTFRNVLKKNNVNPFFFEQANIREHVSWVSLYEKDKAQKLAEDHIRAVVAKVGLNKPLEILEFPVKNEVMVVGGGIAGMYAALNLSENFKVYLVEKETTIGGHMAQLDKTFPTMDCSSCIITPKMSEVGMNPNIELMTYCEIESVEGVVGTLEVTIRKKARKVDYDLCNGCGDCAAVCPVVTGNEFDLNLAHRPAIYMPFPQAIPAKYTVDVDSCIECGLCETYCEPKAIDLSMEDELVTITVGAIILSTGYKILNPSDYYRYKYAQSKNVVTGLQMERILSSFGPTLGKVKRPSDHKEVESIAFLQCVGSRNFRDDINGHKYCSRVCCMYALKQARQFKEKHPDGDAYIFYIDLRCFGKGYEEFYEICGREYGINFIRGRIDEVFEEEDGSLKIIGLDTLISEKIELNVDVLVLNTAIEPQEDAGEFGKFFGVQTTEDGFYMEAHPKLRPVDTLVDGIYLAGTCQAPRDIPDAVAHGQSAAMKAANFLWKGKVEVEPYYSVIDQSLCASCRSCIYVCPYDAISYHEDIDQIIIDERICKGCGGCVAQCPAHAINQHHFTLKQIDSEIDALIASDYIRGVN